MPEPIAEELPTTPPSPLVTAFPATPEIPPATLPTEDLGGQDGLSPIVFPLAPVEPALYENCTYSHYYWGQNPERWMTDNIVTGKLFYSKNQAIQVLTRQSGSDREFLLQQFITAVLNTLKGADGTSISTPLTQAGLWLDQYSYYLALSAAEREASQSLAGALLAFNTGETGPGLCADEPPLPAGDPRPVASPTSTTGSRFTRPLFTSTAVPTIQASPTPTVTPAPSLTPTPTPQDTPTATSILKPGRPGLLPSLPVGTP